MANESPAIIPFNTDGYEISTEHHPIIVKPSAYFATGFGEFRVAGSYTLKDFINKYEVDPRQFGTQTSTGGTITHLPNESAIRLAVTSSNGSTARLRTHTFYRYQAGREMVVKQSLYNNDAGQTNQIRRWGLFDGDDGIFWELNGTTLRLVRRSSTSGSSVDSAVAQSSWNYDPMNGTGPSGLVLDVTKCNIYEIQLQWLGVGQVQCFIDGYLVHVMHHPNNVSVPYMKTAQLPLSYEIVNTGASTGSSITPICASVALQGGEEPQGTSYGAYNATQKTVGTTEIPILSIRPKALYNSITNRAVLFPFKAAISTEGARISYRIIMNASLTGASWTSVDSNSTAEFDVSASSFTGGQNLLIGFIGTANDATNDIDLREFFNEAGRKLRQDAFASSVDTLTIVAVNEATGTTLVKSSISWKEIK